jgi:hypothetical protein
MRWLNQNDPCPLGQNTPGTCSHWHFFDLGPIGPEFSMHKSVTLFYELHSSFSEVASFLAFYERLGHNDPFPPGQKTGTCSYSVLIYLWVKAQNSLPTNLTWHCSRSLQWEIWSHLLMSPWPKEGDLFTLVSFFGMSAKGPKFTNFSFSDVAIFLKEFSCVYICWQYIHIYNIEVLKIIKNLFKELEVFII